MYPGSGPLGEVIPYSCFVFFLLEEDYKEQRYCLNVSLSLCPVPV